MRTTARRAGQVVKKAAQRAGRPIVQAEPPEPSAQNAKVERRRRLLASDLTELAIEFRTDKWGVHRYTPHYERHLQHLRRESFTLLELGIGGYKKRRRSGASMKMWRWFFPKATIVQGDAYDIRGSLDGVIDEPAAATVSSLPLFTKPLEVRLELLGAAHDLMHPNAPFIQFTYAVVPPIPAEGGDYTASRSDRVWLNLPPARVWVYRRP